MWEKQAMVPNLAVLFFSFPLFLNIAVAVRPYAAEFTLLLLTLLLFDRLLVEWQWLIV